MDWGSPRRIGPGIAIRDGRAGRNPIARPRICVRRRLRPLADRRSVIAGLRHGADRRRLVDRAAAVRCRDSARIRRGCRRRNRGQDFGSLHIRRRGCGLRMSQRRNHQPERKRKRAKSHCHCHILICKANARTRFRLPRRRSEWEIFACDFGKIEVDPQDRMEPAAPDTACTIRADGYECLNM